jgi:hypothetical protein
MRPTARLSLLPLVALYVLQAGRLMLPENMAARQEGYLSA